MTKCDQCGLYKLAADFYSHRHHHRSGWCGGAVVVLWTCRLHPEHLANSLHHYDRAPPWPVPGVCTPHAQSLTEKINACNLNIRVLLKSVTQVERYTKFCLTSRCWRIPYIAMPVCWGAVGWRASSGRPQELMTVPCLSQQALVCVVVASWHVILLHTL